MLAKLSASIKICVKIKGFFMTEMVKQKPFNMSIKKSILGAVNKGLVVQVMDGPVVEDYVVFDVKTKQQILRLRENYATVFSSIVFNQDYYYMTKDAYCMVNGVLCFTKDAQSPDKEHYIPESDYKDIYTLVKSVAVKVR